MRGRNADLTLPSLPCGRRSHASLVVEANLGALEQFVRGWRKHFLDSMRPQYLPAHWRVENRVASGL